MSNERRRIWDNEKSYGDVFKKRLLSNLEPVLYNYAYALKLSGEYHKMFWMDRGTPQRLAESNRMPRKKRLLIIQR